MDTILRMLDANLNRAAEALRVAEDVCRFHWDLPGLAAELKSARHELFEAVRQSGIGASALTAARDIEGDVGQNNASPALGALSPEVIAGRNLQRAKEALRVIEECVRGARPGAERVVEAIRYRLYGIERATNHLSHDGARRRSVLSEARLYLIVVPGSVPALEPFVSAAIEGGVDVVQLRAKGVNDREFLKLARRLRELTARAETPFVVNDRPDIAHLARADGVHLGQDDLPVGAARSVVGVDATIGVSTHTEEEARDAVRQGADAIGVGPVFSTATKRDHAPPLGVERAVAIARSVDVPAFLIGGLTGDGLLEAARAGARRVAVASAISGAENVRAAARSIKNALAAR